LAGRTKGNHNVGWPARQAKAASQPPHSKAAFGRDDKRGTPSAIHGLMLPRVVWCGSIVPEPRLPRRGKVSAGMKPWALSIPMLTRPPLALLLVACALAMATTPVFARAPVEGSPVALDRRAQAVVGPDDWELARMASAIVVGTFAAQDGRVTLTVSRTLKGQGVPASVPLLAGQFREATTREKWLAFLAAEGTGYRVLGGANESEIARTEQAVRDVMELDALTTTDEAKCRRLVELARRYSHPSSGCASQELWRYNRAEFVDLLAPLAEGPDRWRYVFLSRNPSPKAASLLLGYLERKQQDAGLHAEDLHMVVDALRLREPNNLALSAELAKHLGHWDPSVRSGIVYGLQGRAYYQATPEVLKCLDDPNSEVRAMAAGWPWWSLPDYRQRVLPRIRALARDDPDDLVRAASCACLVDMRDTRSFYLLLATSLFGNNGTIRSSIALDLLWEDSPVIVSLMLLWPTLLLAGVVAVVRWRFHTPRLLLAAGIGLVCAYLVGAAGGYFLGKYHTSNPIFSATILTPPLVLPVGLLAGVLVWVVIRRAAARE
jgi:hypothetical protein